MRNQKTDYRLSPVWLFAALLFAGCSSEDVSSERANGVTVPLTINELPLEGELAKFIGIYKRNSAIVGVYNPESKNRKLL